MHFYIFLIYIYIYEIYILNSWIHPMASSGMLNTVSISVSDSDPEDPPGRMRVRIRRKRRNPHLPFKDGLLRRALRRAVRWWPLLLFIPAISLLVFEASRLFGKPAVELRSTPTSTMEEEPVGNLNRLDPVTRVIHGVRERKSVEFLDFL